ncbi:MAG: hypothetical protein RIQ93_198, partial [Verrucomicrobiota bacterium]
EQTTRSVSGRDRHWKRNLSSPAAYEESVAANRERFQRMIGMTDARLPVAALDYVASTTEPSQVAGAATYTVHRVRWPVLDGVHGEGLLVQPNGSIRARVVVLPDADQTPEMLLGLAPGVAAESQFARRLAEAGCQLLVPILVDRSATWSGNPAIKQATNQPHREWIYRQAYQMGRHIIGYEVLKIAAALDWFEHEQRAAGVRAGGRVGVAGYGEGGLLALYAAAVDRRIDAALVSGYFAPRQELWSEPIYRNVFDLLEEFGDAEIATLIAPRKLLIEPSATPAIEGPPAAGAGRKGAAIGRIPRPTLGEIRTEVARAHRLLGPALGSSIRLIEGPGGASAPFGTPNTVDQFLSELQITRAAQSPAASAAVPEVSRLAGERQHRQVKELEDYTQKLIITADFDRADFFWARAEAAVRDARSGTPANAWEAATRSYKDYFWHEVIGRLPKGSLPLNARTRLVQDAPRWQSYVVVLDVWPEVITWGYLLVPKNLGAGERRPVVVCQHGIGSTPESTLDRANRAYHGYAAQLADEGFVVFSHYNPNAARGHDRFLELQRLANPIKRSIFSVILGQHERVLDFLSELPFVDPARIGFYGLSYGGKTAMRVPALLERYAVSVCSGDFNEWIRKTITVHAVTASPAAAYRFSGYMYTGEYEVYEFNLARTFNYGEMAALIAPRPFMVERGHDDRVGADEWVAYEYAKVFRLYNSTLKIPERTALTVFDGGHEIKARETVKFLRRHLNWPSAAR